MQNNLEIWENIFKSSDWGQYPAVSVIKFVARNFYKYENRKEVKILELGAGTGANLWFCAREGFSVYSIDGSETAIEKMKKRFEKEGLSSSLIGTSTGDYYDVLEEIDDNSFDAIIDVESLCCNEFNRTKEIVKKSLNKLKVGGVMFSQTFADGTYGFEGEEVSYHSTIAKSGPLEGKGLNRYTTKEDIEILYSHINSEVTSIERQDLILNDGNIIKEWLVELRKV